MLHKIKDKSEKLCQETFPYLRQDLVFFFFYKLKKINVKKQKIKSSALFTLLYLNRNY